MTRRDIEASAAELLERAATLTPAGRSLEEIGDYVGHASAYMTDRYRHLLDGARTEAAAGLDASSIIRRRAGAADGDCVVVSRRMSDRNAEGVAVPIVWNGPEDVPILYVNAFVCQFDQQTLDSFILTIGQLTPPALMGTPDEVREQAEQISFIPVKPVARLGLTTARMQELIAILQANLDQLDRATTMRPGDPR